MKTLESAQGEVWQGLWDNIQTGVFVYITLNEANDGTKANLRYMLVPKDAMGVFEDILGRNPNELRKNFYSVFNLAITHNFVCRKDQPSVSYLWNSDDWSLQKL